MVDQQATQCCAMRSHCAHRCRLLPPLPTASPWRAHVSQQTGRMIRGMHCTIHLQMTFCPVNRRRQRTVYHCQQQWRRLCGPAGSRPTHNASVASAPASRVISYRQENEEDTAFCVDGGQQGSGRCWVGLSIGVVGCHTAAAAAIHQHWRPPLPLPPHTPTLGHTRRNTLPALHV